MQLALDRLLSEKPAQALLRVWHKRWVKGNQSPLIVNETAIPELYPSCHDEFRFCEGLLAALEKAGALSFHSQQKSLRANPRLIIEPSLDDYLTHTFGPKKEKFSSASVIWHPLLSFAHNQRDGKTLALLLVLNDWLGKNEASLRLVPYRIQSFEIFGDEKALDGRIDVITNTLFDGRLPLEAIGGYCPSIPIMPSFNWAAPFSGLIVENHHSYADLVAWNQRTNSFRTILLGMGAQVLGAVESIFRLTTENSIDKWYYIGDVDPAGIRIASLLTDRLALLGVSVEPWLHGWTKLIGTNRTAPLCSDDHCNLSWLPAHLIAKATQLFNERLRIPQEALAFSIETSSN